MEILHIVPGTPSPTSAIADGAWLFCQAARAQGISSRLLCHPEDPDARFDIDALRLFDEQGPRRPVDLRRRPGERILVLHYNGFSYSRHGAPLSFVDGFLRQRHEIAARLVTVFHELWVEFLPWRRTAWHLRSQRDCVRRLVGASDLAICSTQWAETRLRAMTTRTPVIRHPVYSNVGELRDFPAKEPGLAVMFGVNRRLVHRFIRREPETLRRLGITRVLDIGPPLPPSPPRASLPVEALGVLPAADVSRWFTKAALGLISYPTRHIAKSGSFAALTAHGACCINLDPDSAPADGLREGLEFLGRPSFGRDLSPAMVRDIGVAGFDWYQGHTLSTNVERFIDAVGSLGVAAAPADVP